MMVLDPWDPYIFYIFDNLVISSIKVSRFVAPYCISFLYGVMSQVMTLDIAMIDTVLKYLLKNSVRIKTQGYNIATDFRQHFFSF